MADTVDEMKKEKNLLQNLLTTMDNGEISKDEYKILQYFLFKYEQNYHYNYPLSKTSLNENRIMFISDTHYGNPQDENDRLVYIAYNEAIRQNIKTVVHIGDLIEAGCINHEKTYGEVYNELKKAIDSMPNEVTTKLLLGNHDYSAIRTYPNILKCYFQQQKLDILGMMKVLLNWQDIADIYLYHDIKQLKDKNPLEQHGILRIEGHHHYLDFLEKYRMLYLPSLSNKFITGTNSLKDMQHIRYYPIFIVGNITDINKIVFSVYYLDSQLKLPQIKNMLEVNTQTKELKLYK